MRVLKIKINITVVKSSVFAAKRFAKQLEQGLSHQIIQHFDPPPPSLHNCANTCPGSYRGDPCVIRFAITQIHTNSTLGNTKMQVEIIDGHNLPKAPGQLSINPYVVLTLNGEPFARSSSSRGAAFPVWSSEVFMVRLPPPTRGEWPLTSQKYFQGYRCDTAHSTVIKIFSNGGSEQNSNPPPWRLVKCTARVAERWRLLCSF